MTDSRRTRRPATPARSQQTMQLVPTVQHQLPSMVTASNPQLPDQASTQWQFDDWQSLVKLNCETLQHHPDRAKLALQAAAGLLQTGQYAEAKAYIRRAQDWGISKKLISQILIAGVHNSLGRAAAVMEHQQRSLDHFNKSIVLGTPETEHRLFIHSRADEQLSELDQQKTYGLPLENNLKTKINDEERKLFIDCGGYDGCSAIKFLMENDSYECVSFEPNPDLWHYFFELPVHLIRKAVSTYDGSIEFLIDPVDGDGSSYIKEKNVTLNGIIPNSECPKLIVECVSLSNYVREQAKKYKTIILKLDIEGAEYQVLEDMINLGAIRHIDALYCEFHWKKIGLSENQHMEFIDKLNNHVNLANKEWDALDYSIHQNSTSKLVNIRRSLVSILNKKLTLERIIW